MTRHIHIANVAKSTEPVLKGIRAIGGIDKVYLFYVNKYKEECGSLRDDLFKKEKIDCELIPVENLAATNLTAEMAQNIFQDIIDKMFEIYQNNYDGKDTEFSINITTGNNLMSTALCSSAYFVGATIYYVLWNDNLSITEQLVKIDTPRVPDIQSIGRTGRIVMKYICEETEKNRDVTNKTVTEFLQEKNGNCSKNNAKYYIQKLEKENLITISIGANIRNNSGRVVYDKRARKIEPTRQGRLIAKWLDVPQE